MRGKITFPISETTSCVPQISDFFLYFTSCLLYDHGEAPQCKRRVTRSIAGLLLLHCLEWVCLPWEHWFKCHGEVLCGGKKKIQVQGSWTINTQISLGCFLSAPSHGVVSLALQKKHLRHRETLIQGLQAQLPFSWPSHIREEPLPPPLRSGPGQERELTEPPSSLLMKYHTNSCSVSFSLSASSNATGHIWFP